MLSKVFPKCNFLINKKVDGNKKVTLKTSVRPLINEKLLIRHNMVLIEKYEVMPVF